MSAAAAAAAPQVRLRPIPVLQPYAAVRVLEPAPVVTPGQQALVLPLGPRLPGGPDRRPTIGQDAAEPQLVASSRATGLAVSSGIGGTCATAPGAPDQQVLLWAGQFVQAAVEVAAGLRSPSQLTRWTTDGVREGLAQRGALNRRAPSREAARRTVVRSVRASHPTPGVTEASAVVADGRRLRAVAFRMETYQNRWRVTALQIG